MTSRARLLRLALAGVAAVPPTVAAQGTAADYARAEQLATRWDGLVVNAPGPATWVAGSHRFWYRKSVKGGYEFELVDADAHTKGVAFDHARLAAALSTASGRTHAALALPFSTMTFAGDGGSIEFAADSASWRCDLGAYRCDRVAGAAFGGRRGGGPGGFGGAGPGAAERPRPSPDGSMEAFIRNYNIWVRHPGRADATTLTTDGSEGNYYSMRTLVWSPDSKAIAAYRVIPGYRRYVHYVQSSPEDQVQPKYTERLYLKPGDVLDKEQPVILRVSDGREIGVDNALFPNAYEMSDPVWRRDSHAFTFEYNQRGHQVYRVLEVDANSGAVRSVISEEPKTFFDYRTITPNMADHGNKFRYDIDDGREVIWMSERDGWAHLYLMDGATGAVKNQITQGRLGGSRGGQRRRRQPPDLVPGQRDVPGQGPVLRALLPHQLRRHGARRVHRGRRDAHGQLVARSFVLRGHLDAGGPAAGLASCGAPATAAWSWTWRRGMIPRCWRRGGARRTSSRPRAATARPTSGA